MAKRLASRNSTDQHRSRSPAVNKTGVRRPKAKKGVWDELVQSAPGTPMGKLLRQFWQPVAISNELAPGSAMPIRVMCENLTLYRGENGAPYIVDHVCPHRLTLLHTGWVEGDCLRCRYHGWKFDGRGQCIEMPAEEDAFPPKVRITSYPAADYAGIIFAWMGDGAPPPLPRKREMERDYGVQWASTQVWPCNWFQRIENSMDAVHVSFVHRETGFGEVLSYAVPTLRYEETEWGIRQYASRSNSNVRISNFSFPNCNHIVVPTGKAHGSPAPRPWTDIFNWFVPVDGEHTAFFTARSAPIRGADAEVLRDQLAATDRWNPADHAEELFKGNMPSDNSGDTATALVNAQDYLVQVGQGAIVDRSRERLGKSDEGVIFLRKVFQRELAAIKSGKPTKRWNQFEDFARLPLPPNVPPAPDL